MRSPTTASASTATPTSRFSTTTKARPVTGFIDARRQNDGVWAAWVWFYYDDENGWRATRKNWVTMDRLHPFLSIDDVTVEGERHERQI